MHGRIRRGYSTEGELLLSTHGRGIRGAGGEVGSNWNARLFRDSCFSFSYTDQALRELMSQLDGQPELYKSVLQKRRRAEKEEEGLMSFLKVRLTTPPCYQCMYSTVLLAGEVLVDGWIRGHLLFCI